MYSRGVRKKSNDLYKAILSIQFKTGNKASNDDICKELDITDKKLFKIRKDINNSTLLNLDEFINSESTYPGSRFIDSMESRDNTVDNKYINEETNLILIKTLSKLPQKHRIIINLYYFKEITLKEVGVILSLTESRICQIHKQILIDLKRSLKCQLNLIGEAIL